MSRINATIVSIEAGSGDAQFLFQQQQGACDWTGPMFPRLQSSRRLAEQVTHLSGDALQLLIVDCRQ